MTTPTRQIGEAVAWRTRGPRGGWLHSDILPSGWRMAEPLIPASDLEQITRERDEAARLLDAAFVLAEHGPLDAKIEAFLSRFATMEKTD